MAELFEGVVVVRRFFLGLRLEGAALRLLGHIGRMKISAAGWIATRCIRALAMHRPTALPATLGLLSGQLEFILKPQREFIEQIGQARAVGLFVAQDFDFAVQSRGGIAAQLINLG